eukprot:3249799-Prymnesium_polylepis.1
MQFDPGRFEPGTSYGNIELSRSLVVGLVPPLSRCGLEHTLATAVVVCAHVCTSPPRPRSAQWKHSAR